MTPTEEIKQRLDLVDLIQEYVRLTPAGSNLKAKCPFHNEKTPSFMVSSEKQIWHCFGCGAGGDHFDFIRLIEGIEFPEALRILADKAGVRLDYRNPELHSRKTRLLDLINEIASYWHQQLKTNAQAEFVRKYLSERRVTGSAIDNFLLGYSSESWDSAIKHLQDKGYSLMEIAQAGISAVGDKGRLYDRFRGRLIFPIKNIHGQLAGFGGRIMKEEAGGGKYINSPQTDVYNKSEILYNLDQAKTEIKRTGYAILVEGYMDVLGCWQAGTKNVVAVSGTSLTEGQIKLLKRYTDNVMIAFDADVAGTLANLRGIDLAWQAGFNVKVIHLPTGQDPDEVIKEDKEKWRQLVSGADNFLDYIFKVTLGQLNLKRVDHKKKAAQQLLAVIAKLGDEVEAAHYLKKLSSELEVGEESLIKALTRFKNKQTEKRVTKESQLPVAIVMKNHQQLLAERLLYLLMKFPQEITFVSQYLDPLMISHQEAQLVYKQLIIHYNKEQSFKSDLFLTEIPSAINNYLNRLLLLVEVDQTADNPLVLKEEFNLIINRLKKSYLNERIAAVGKEIARAEKENNQESLSNLNLEFNKLVSQLKDL